MKNEHNKHLTEAIEMLEQSKTHLLFVSNDTPDGEFTSYSIQASAKGIFSLFVNFVINEPDFAPFFSAKIVTAAKIIREMEQEQEAAK